MTKIDKSTENRLVLGMTQMQSNFLQNKLTYKVVENWIASWVKEQISFLEDIERAKEFRKAIPISATTDENYLPKIIEFEGCLSIVGVRFKGGAPNKPYLALYAYENFFDNDISLFNYLEVCFKAFEVFMPTSLEIWHSPTRKLPVGGRVEVHTTHRLLAHSILERPDLIDDGREDIGFLSIIDKSVYHEYVQSYTSYLDKYPELVGEIEPEDFSELVELFEEGSAKVVTIGGVRAGVIAAEKACTAGIQNTEIIEICLFESFRGKGHASAVVESFTKSLTEEHIVTGVVHVKNIPSSRAFFHADYEEILISSSVSLN